MNLKHSDTSTRHTVIGIKHIGHSAGVGGNHCASSIGCGAGGHGQTHSASTIEQNRIEGNRFLVSVPIKCPRKSLAEFGLGEVWQEVQASLEMLECWFCKHCAFILHKNNFATTT